VASPETPLGDLTALRRLAGFNGSAGEQEEDKGTRAEGEGRGRKKGRDEKGRGREKGGQNFYSTFVVGG